MTSVAQITKNLGGVISKNSPHILTGLGCAGVLSTTILAVRATPLAIDAIETHKKRLKRTWDGPADEIQLSKRTIIELTWKYYIPTAVLGATTIGCIIGANTVNMRRNAALASLYAVSETAFREYKTKVVQELGAQKELKIRDEINRDHVTNNPIQGSNIIFTGNGDVLCLDKLSGQPFMSSYETIRQKVNDLNYRLRNEMTINLNEFYYELGLPEIGLGDLMEFNIEKGLIEPHYSSQLTPEGKPCLVIEYNVYPVYAD